MRRHHNTNGLRQIRRGKTRRQVAAMARRLGVVDQRMASGSKQTDGRTTMRARAAVDAIVRWLRGDEDGRYGYVLLATQDLSPAEWAEVQRLARHYDCYREIELTVRRLRDGRSF